MKTLEQILNALEMGASITAELGPIPQIVASAKLADYFLKIAQSAVRAHESITGKPLDLGTLHEITLVD